MPIQRPMPARVLGAGLPQVEQVNKSLAAIEGSGSRLYNWFDTILTGGSAASIGSSVRLQDMWEEQLPQLVLETAGTPLPTLQTISNGKKALQFTNGSSAPYCVMGAVDNASLAVPDATQWSVLFHAQPTGTAGNYFLGYEVGAPNTSSDYSITVQFVNGSGKTQYVRLLRSDLGATRIADTANEYANVDTIICIGFDTTTGLTMSRNGVPVAFAPSATQPLTSRSFQIGGVGAGNSSVDYRGYVGALLTYPVNVFLPQNQDLHRAAVASYCTALGLSHPF